MHQAFFRRYACRFLETRELRREFDGVSNPRQRCEGMNDGTSDFGENYYWKKVRNT